MSEHAVTALLAAQIEPQSSDVRNLSESEREALIVKALQVDGHWIILSRYSDDLWLLDGFTSNTPDSEKRVDYGRVPAPFRPVMKALMYRYLRRGRAGQKRPRGSTLRGVFKEVLPFLRYLNALKLKH